MVWHPAMKGSANSGKTDRKRFILLQIGGIKRKNKYGCVVMHPDTHTLNQHYLSVKKYLYPALLEQGKDTLGKISQRGRF